MTAATDRPSSRARRALLIAMLGALLQPSPAAADEIRVLASVGIQTVVEELAPRFEKASGHSITLIFDLSSTLKGRIEKDEPFDVAILTPPLIDELFSRKLVASKAQVARTGLGIMIKSGNRTPDIGSVDALKRTLLAASAIAYPEAGASGTAFLAIAKQLGIAGTIRTKPAASAAAVNASILDGTADLAVAPISEILPVKGAALAGPFPAAVQTYIVMTAATRVATPGAAVNAFLAYLTSPANDGVLKAKGMERN